MLIGDNEQYGLYLFVKASVTVQSVVVKARNECIAYDCLFEALTKKSFLVASPMNEYLKNEL